MSRWGRAARCSRLLYWIRNWRRELFSEAYLSPAQDGDTHVRSVEFFCHSRACVWRARGIPNSAGGRGEGPGFFARQPRARMTEQEIEQDRSCHYDLQRLDSPRDCRWRQTYPRRTPEKGVGRVEICVAD